MTANNILQNDMYFLTENNRPVKEAINIAFTDKTIKERGNQVKYTYNEKTNELIFKEGSLGRATVFMDKDIVDLSIDVIDGDLDWVTLYTDPAGYRTFGFYAKDPSRLGYVCFTNYTISGYEFETKHPEFHSLPSKKIRFKYDGEGWNIYDNDHLLGKVTPEDFPLSSSETSEMIPMIGFKIGSGSALPYSIKVKGYKKSTDGDLSVARSARQRGYVKTDWVAYETVVSADSLNNIENQLDYVTNKTDSFETAIAELDTSISNHVSEDATLAQKGHVQLTNDLGNSEELAVTQKALNDVTLKHDTRLSSLESKLQSGEPVETTLRPSTNQVTAPVSATAQIKSIQGRTIANHVPPFDSGLWKAENYLSSSGESFNINSPNSFTINITKTHTEPLVYQCPISLKPNTTYTLSIGSTGLEKTPNQTCVDVYKYTALDSDNVDGSFPVTFTTPSDVSDMYVRIILTADVPIGTYEFKDIMVVEGSTKLPFVQGVQGITNPTIENTKNETSLTAITTLYEGESLSLNDRGQLVKTKRYEEYNVLGGLPITNIIKRTGHTRVGLQTTLDFIGTTKTNSYMIKHDGTLLGTYNSFANDADIVDKFSMDKNHVLYISIPNVDSGWGDNYTPTADEVYAYFLGWKMYLSGDGTNQYDGTGTKKWTPIQSYNGTDYSGYVNTVPTVAPTSDVVSGTWRVSRDYKPYKLIFERTNPLTEIVPTMGSLTLEKDNNELLVSAGRIVGEITTPKYLANYGWFIGDTALNVLLRYAPKSFYQIYKNGTPEKQIWNIYAGNNSQGAVKANLRERDAALFSDTSIYTVDYEPLYLFQVTAPIDSVTIEWQSNLGGVIDQLVDMTAANRSEIANIEGAISELFQSASNGKKIIATAITGKGVATSSSDTFDTMANNIGQISTGKKWASGTATATSATKLTVSGLGFKPSVVIIRPDSGGSYQLVYTEIGNNDYNAPATARYKGNSSFAYDVSWTIGSTYFTASSSGGSLFSTTTSAYAWIAFE